MYPKKAFDVILRLTIFGFLAKGKAVLRQYIVRRVIANIKNTLFPDGVKLLLRGYTPSLPIQIELQHTGEILYCQHSLRIIPKKRLVTSGKWGDKEVIAKLFYQRKKAKKNRQQDARGIHALTAAGILTPKLLYEGEAYKGRIHVLIFEKINHADTLDALWQTKKNAVSATDREELTQLLDGVILELATQHVLGIFQRDLHLNNFLIVDEKMITLDGASVIMGKNILTKEQSLANLSLFFAQLGAGTESLQDRLFEKYAKARGWLIQKNDKLHLKKLVQKKIQKRWMHYAEKIFRNCSAFKKIHLIHCRGMIDRSDESPAFLDFIHDPQKFFHAPISVLKAGRSSTVIKISIDNKMFVVKRYNLKNKWHWLRRCLRVTRAEAGWRLAHYLRFSTIATPRPVAYIEQNFLGCRGVSYFVMEFIEGESIGDYFGQNPLPDQDEMDAVAEKTIALFKGLVRLKITHGDLKKTNILLTPDRAPLLIDLDGMREHRTRIRFQKMFRGEINRFMKNWERQPAVYNLFNKAYDLT